MATSNGRRGMKLTEVRGKIDAMIEEFGDAEAFLVPELEPAWRNPLTDIDFEPDRQAAVFSSRE